MRELARLALALWLALALPAAAAPPPASPSSSASPFANWAAVVVAGDWHGHEGGPSEAFDNARRDVSAAFRAAGFRAQNLREFSVRPARYRPRPAKSDIDGIYDALSALTARAPEGCLVYFSSHGAPNGVVVGDDLLAPSVLGAMLDQACGRRPTVVIVSACFSGVFVPELAAPNRMVLTAARADRSSFGCGEADRYPYFDDCFLRSFPAAHDLRQLAGAVQACVARREIETGMAPPSEPQLSIGAAIKPLLPLYALPAGAMQPAQF
ncbi:caspase family protein [Phenylobacterium sp. LjRoot225]|uniref:C13 family peptidase n=1 Tax=Phenylobacterium sp. LjRoot225 TaxID=3342285 RepID=UPI003ECFEDC0